MSRRLDELRDVKQEAARPRMSYNINVHYYIYLSHMNIQLFIIITDIFQDRVSKYFTSHHVLF